mgnify:CR=1 FL=1
MDCMLLTVCRVSPGSYYGSTLARVDGKLMPALAWLCVRHCLPDKPECILLTLHVGVLMCFGSDLLGELHPQQNQEFAIRAQVQDPKVYTVRASLFEGGDLFCVLCLRWSCSG